MSYSRSQTECRGGFSLLEVILALTIFLFGLIAVGKLVTLSTDRAQEVQQQSMATQLCQSKLAEVLAGAVPLTSQSNAPFDEDPSWTWSLDCEQGSVSGLWNVHVRATRERPDGTKVESVLHQMVLDPSLRGSTLDAVAAAAANPNSVANSTASSSSSSSGTGATGSSPTANAGGAGASGMGAMGSGTNSTPKSSATGASTPAATPKASTSTGSPSSSSGAKSSGTTSSAPSGSSSSGSAPKSSGSSSSGTSGSGSTGSSSSGSGSSGSSGSGSKGGTSKGGG